MQESELTVGIPSKLIRDLVEGLRAIVGRALHGDSQASEGYEQKDSEKRKVLYPPRSNSNIFSR